MPLQILLEAGPTGQTKIREGIITLKADIDMTVKNGVVDYKPDVGIKKLVLVADDEEKGTEQDAVKALVNLMIS